MKYKAIMNVMIEIHPEKDGIIQAENLSSAELKKYNINNANPIVVIEGATKNDCVTKVKDWLNKAN